MDNTTITIVAAVAKNNAIGRKGRLLWDLPEDMRRFKYLTEGHAVVMGRRTYSSIPKGLRPLENRLNIVLGKQRKGMVSAPTLFFVKRWDIAIRCARDRRYNKIFIIGGERLYEKALEVANDMYLTHVKANFTDADTYFPKFDTRQWRKVSSETYVSMGEGDDYPMEFAYYKRNEYFMF